MRRVSPLPRLTSVLALLLLGLAACGGEPTGSARPLPIAFSSAPVPVDSVAIYRTQHETGAVPPVSVAVEGGLLTVSGYFETPCMRDPMEGRATARGEQVVLVVRAINANPGLCLTATDPYRYRATFQSLVPGTYQLTVRHERDAVHPERIVLQQEVTIP